MMTKILRNQGRIEDTQKEKRMRRTLGISQSMLVILLLLFSLLLSSAIEYLSLHFPFGVNSNLALLFYYSLIIFSVHSSPTIEFTSSLERINKNRLITFSVIP